mmetsp:Transcript_37741/g.53241  ORF Transcript_37741/g.53241 Transcript_37741/m.53241 type:complete len:175 (-) Transcript_37741:196-720(-)
MTRPHYFNTLNNDDLWNLRPRRGRGRVGVRGGPEVPENVEFSAQWNVQDDDGCSSVTMNARDFLYEDTFQTKSCLSKRTTRTEIESICSQEQIQERYALFVAYLRYKREEGQEAVNLIERKRDGLLGRLWSGYLTEPSINDFVPDQNGIVKIRGEGRFFFPRDSATNEVIAMKL